MVAGKTGISVISGSRPTRAGGAGAPPGRVLRSKRKTSRFPKTFPRISLISLPEAATLHPATENPTGSLAAPRTAGTLPEQPDHPPPGSAVTVTLGKPELTMLLAADVCRDYRFRRDCRATDAVVGQCWAVLDGGPGDGGPVV